MLRSRLGHTEIAAQAGAVEVTTREQMQGMRDRWEQRRQGRPLTRAITTPPPPKPRH